MPATGVYIVASSLARCPQNLSLCRKLKPPSAMKARPTPVSSRRLTRNSEFQALYAVTAPPHLSPRPVICRQQPSGC